ncbi:hypothetical protein [Nocardioides sp. WS12]|uniref:hypothetical protein n=1 Tax=Nocardioides sp. WS12 TaxID=2486272 RepID=UPI0015F9D8D6|nr:hypothetical protein [Nocardioides sp. WS12]
MKFNSPFLFAIPHGMPTADRERVPGRIAKNFGITGPITFVRADDRMRLYALHHNGKSAA